MESKFTAEQRQKQAERIRQSAPWTKSTGPKSAEGKRRVSQNSRKIELSPATTEFYAHRDNPTIIGFLSDYTVPLSHRIGYTAGDIAQLAGGGTTQLLNELVEILELAGETVSDADITDALRILVEEY